MYAVTTVTSRSSFCIWLRLLFDRFTCYLKETKLFTFLICSIPVSTYSFLNRTKRMDKDQKDGHRNRSPIFSCNYLIYLSHKQARKALNRNTEEYKEKYQFYLFYSLFYLLLSSLKCPFIACKYLRERFRSRYVLARDTFRFGSIFVSQLQLGARFSFSR